MNASDKIDAARFFAALGEQEMTERNRRRLRRRGGRPAERAKELSASADLR
jgi:hypothetical protein